MIKKYLKKNLNCFESIDKKFNTLQLSKSKTINL